MYPRQMLMKNENLQKVYSIWICMNCAQRDANTISEYGMMQRSCVGEYTGSPRIDLLSVIMIRLPKDNEWEKAKNPATNLTQMLSTLLSNTIAPDKKITALEKEYGIEATEEIREEVNEMCNYSSAVADSAVNLNKKDTAVTMIRNGETDEKIILYTKLTKEQVEELRRQETVTA